MISEQTVDLRPLLEWWSSAERGERPLSGWKLVRGRIVRNTAYGWIIQGEAEGENQASQFLLKNPPRERLQKFHEVQCQLSIYEQERDYLNDYLERAVRMPYDSTSDSAFPSVSWSDQMAAVTRLLDLDRTIPALRQELGRLQDERGNFKLDTFALRLNERYQGLPVFDHGYPLPVPSLAPRVSATGK
jgi:hypothetical protein